MKKEKYILYRCTHRKKYINCSQRRYINEEKIEEQLAGKVKEITITNMIRDLLLHSIKKKNDINKKIHVNGLIHWQNVQKQCEERLSRLIDALADDILEKEEFLEKKQEILSKKAEAKERIEKHETGAKGWYDYAEKLIMTINHAYKVFSEGIPEDKKSSPKSCRRKL